MKKRLKIYQISKLIRFQKRNQENQLLEFLLILMEVMAFNGTFSRSEIKNNQIFLIFYNSYTFKF